MLGWSEILTMFNEKDEELFKKDLMKYECDDKSVGFLCFGESYRQFASKDLIIPISDIRNKHCSFIIESCMLYSEAIKYSSERSCRYTCIGNMDVDVDVVLEIQKEIEKSIVKMPGVLCKIISEYSSPVCGIDVLREFVESVFKKCQSYLIDNVSRFNLTREDVLRNFVNPVNNTINICYSRELDSRYYDKDLNKKKYMSITDKSGYIKPLIRVTHLEIQKNGRIYLNIELM
jgi:hypothetical protein